MVRSGFQFANPILERVSFVTNNKFDSDKFEGIDIESQTSVEMHEENTATIGLIYDNNTEAPLTFNNSLTLAISIVSLHLNLALITISILNGWLSSLLPTITFKDTFAVFSSCISTFVYAA